MSGNAHSPSYLSNNVNFNRSLAYNGSPVIKGNLRSDTSLNENGKGNYGHFDQMRQVMGRSFPPEMWPSQSARYGLPSNFKSDFSSHGYNFPKLVPDEFMSQGYQQGFKMPCNEFLPYSPSNSQMIPPSQSLPSLIRHSENQHSSSETSMSSMQGPDKFLSDSRPSTISPPNFFAKASKCGDLNLGKKSQENLSSEDMSTDSDVSGSNLPRSAGTSRPSTPNRSLHPTPPSSGCSSSRPSTPSQSAGLMPPPLNPGQQGQNRVFSPVTANNSGFYAPHFHMSQFNRSGGPVMGQEHPQFGGFPYPIHSSPMIRPNQHSYRMREPHYADIRHYPPHIRMMDSRHESDQEYLRHNYRHNFLTARAPPGMTYGHMGDFPLRASFENYNSPHDSSIPSNISRKLPGDPDLDKSAFERNYMQKHSLFPRQTTSSPFSTSSKSPLFRDETMDSQTIQVSSPSGSMTSVKYQMPKLMKHNFEVEEFGVSFPAHPSFPVRSHDPSSRPHFQPNKDNPRQQEEFDDHSSTQDTFEENKNMSDSLVTDESNTSDTLLSYPGTSFQSQNENSNVDEPVFESPHKKLKQDLAQRPFQDNHKGFGQNEAFCKLLEMGKEPERPHFLQDLFSFMESKQMPIVSMPTVSKQPIDLFKLYCVVRKYGGMVEVTKEKKWRDVSGALNMGPSSSAGFVLKKNYGKNLFPYECYRHQGNIDPLPILACLDQPLKKVSKRSEYSNFDVSDLQNSSNLSESVAPNKAHQSQGHYLPQAAISVGPTTSGHYVHGHQSYIPDNAFPPPGSRYNRYSISNNCSGYEHLQMICPPSSPSVKIEKRVIGSHIQKELLFPSSSVESTRPKCIKRKRLNLKQIGQVDAWHLVMSLKSGLTCESAWALNVLTGLLGDDTTFPFFCLQSMPGLIETLLDHFRASLIALFGQKFKDLELDWSARGDHVNFDTPYKKASSHHTNSLKDQCYNHRMLENSKENYKRRIKLETNSGEEKWLNDQKIWDCEGQGEFESSAFDWHLGRGDSSKHIFLNAESSGNKDFQKFFGNNWLKFVKRNDLTTCKRTNNNIKDADALEELDPLLDEAIVTKKSNSVGSETFQCNHKICQDIHFYHPNMCLQESFLKSRDDWYSGETQEEKRNFNLFSEAFYERERRCLQLSNILRSLSFVPGNDSEMSKHSGLLVILARLMLLEHEHIDEAKTRQQSPSLEAIKMLDPNVDQEENSHKELQEMEPHCPPKMIEMLREDALVILANISGQLDLSFHADEICSPILDAILHWTTCFTTVANDSNSFSSIGHTEPGSIMPSFAMLALETTSKLCILDSNVDLLMATPPFSRVVSLIHRLSELLSFGAVGDQVEDDSPSWMSDQIAREFSLVILSSLVQTYPTCAHLLAINRNLISILLNFIEVQCLKMHIAANASTPPLYNNCSPDMLKRAVIILHRVSQVKGKDELERQSLLRYKDRLLDLLCHKLPKSNFLSSIVSDVLSFTTF